MAEGISTMIMWLHHGHGLFRDTMALASEGHRASPAPHLQAGGTTRHPVSVAPNNHPHHKTAEITRPPRAHPRQPNQHHPLPSRVGVAGSPPSHAPRAVLKDARRPPPRRRRSRDAAAAAPPPPPPPRASSDQSARRGGSPPLHLGPPARHRPPPSRPALTRGGSSGRAFGRGLVQLSHVEPSTDRGEVGHLAVVETTLVHAPSSSRVQTSTRCSSGETSTYWRRLGMRL